MDLLIEKHWSESVAVAKKEGRCNVPVFGSMARGDADETSDTDLLGDSGPNCTL